MPVDDVFLSRVGHDLRGELATMVAGVHYLLRYEDGLSDAGRQMLERVNGAGQRLKRLLDELELSVWIAGRPVDALFSEPVRLAVLVHAALARLERSVAQRAVTVDVRVPDELAEFEGDPELLGVAVEYALDFAIARSPERTIHVTGALLGRAPVLLIADEGDPAPDAALARIFEPFVEKDLLPRPEPGARRRERLGLGLPIARGIFAGHGGGLTAEAGPGGRGIALTCKLGPG
jgi:K+-sensing histidine kinase KdpD